MSLYTLKPRFQALLRPLVRRLAVAGITANQVTLLACAVSVALGAWLTFGAGPRAFLLLPLWMLLRMALNAVDGMLAREWHQRSALGGYLNELTDLVSDAALYLPFVWLSPWAIGALVWLSAASEMAGALGPAAGASRRQDGPLGKSDRALAFGALGLWTGLAGALPAAAAWVLWALVALSVCTVVQRVRRGLAESSTLNLG